MRNLLKQVAQPQIDLITYIYGLVDPRTGLVRYIGKADIPQVRYKNHLCPPETNADTKKSRWINKLLRMNIRPSLVILQVVKRSDWRDAERKWISDYRQKYGRHFLTNTTAGGDGIEKGFKQRPGTGAKISAANKGRKVSEETKVKISLSNLGRKRSDEARKRMSEGVRASHKSMTPAERKAKFGHPRELSEEECKRLAASIRQKNKSPNTSSAFIGVSWCKKTKRWKSSIRFEGKTFLIGDYDEEIDAARARDMKAIELAGDAYRLNFPREEYENDAFSNHQQPKREVQKNNKSGYRGVCFNNRYGRVKRWTATGSINGKNTLIGYFSDKVEAAHAYDQWVIEHHDSSAYTNFPRAYYEQTPWRPAPKEKNKTVAQSSKVNNRSGFRGITKSGKNGWKTVIHYMGTVYRLGPSKTAEEAARRYDRKMIELRGDSARTNFPRSSYD